MAQSQTAPSSEVASILAILKGAGLSFSFEQIPQRTDQSEWAKDASHWRGTLKNSNGRTFTFEYSQGAAYRRWRKDAASRKAAYSLSDADKKQIGYAPGQRVPHGFPPVRRTLWELGVLEKFTEPTPPDVANVAHCLASDWQSIENVACFEEWCAELGYEEDSRKAHATYLACLESSKKFASLVGREVAQALADVPL